MEVFQKGARFLIKTIYSQGFVMAPRLLIIFADNHKQIIGFSVLETARYVMYIDRSHKTEEIFVI